MPRRIAVLLAILSCLLIADETLTALCLEFEGLDLLDDGDVEIPCLQLLEGSAPDEDPAAPLVLVLVESRLLETPDGEAELLPHLQTFVSDLRAEGWRARLLEAQLYQGPRHQDGRSLLALRRFFQAVWRQDPQFAGALLVGSFPEAFLVRNYNWRKKGRLTLRKGTPEEKSYENVPYLRAVPEPVAQRCELVLADLDGAWEDRYIEQRERLPTLIGIYPDGVPSRGGPCADYQRGSVVFEDFFYVNDGRFDARERLAAGGTLLGLDIEVLDEYENAECNPSDKSQGNPLARPDVGISRIDARHVALRPRADVRGLNGEGLLDADGQPQRVDFGPDAKIPSPLSLWERDPQLELQLLREYFVRNHAFRLGMPAEHFRPAAIARDLGNGFAVARDASDLWQDCDQPAAYQGHTANLLDYVAWLKEPAALRDVRAHTDCYGSIFGKVQAAKLVEAVGGTAWGWSKRGSALVPGLHTSKADFPLYRSLWENSQQARGGALYLHTGCDVVSPASASKRAYNHPGYGHWQGAECLLFYADALVLLGRAKVFYDAPRGFSQVLAGGGTMAEAWQRYFQIESEAASAAKVGGGIGRKRAYFWSLVGDWTLRLRAPTAP